MKLSESEAHVSLGQSEVARGDQVALYRNYCQRRTAPTKGVRLECEKRRLGEGRISETLSADYSVMEVPAGVGFQEGDLVEVTGR